MSSKNSLSFQEIILKLHEFWSEKGCAILQGYDVEVGAGTLSPYTSLRAVDDKPWNVSYVQACRRPADGRYGENPNRLQHYYQYQTLLKPCPDNAQELLLESYERIGIDRRFFDIRFVEDDWENPSIGAKGMGWEVWCDGMEVTQFTYFQQVGGIPVSIPSVELTYGLERLAMKIQGVKNVFDLDYNGKGLTYGDVFKRAERDYSRWNFELSDADTIMRHFEDCERESKKLAEAGCAQPAYDYCLKASHLFNLLDARGVVSVSARAGFIQRIRSLAQAACQAWIAEEAK